MSVLVITIIVLVLILLNGLFVAAEFAIVAAPRHTIAKLAEEGSRRAKQVAKILDDPLLQDRYIATAQLGITAASLALGMYGEKQLAELMTHALETIDLPSWIGAHAIASVIAIGLLTYLHIVLGEMIPKGIALARTERAVLWLAPPMRVIQLVLLPFVVAFTGLGNLLLKLVGVERSEAHRHHTPAELRQIVRESEQGGMLASEAAMVVDELLDLGGITAREALVPRVQIRGLRLGADLDELTKLVVEHAHTRYPVHAGDLDKVVGMIHIKDALRAIRSGRTIGQADVRSIPFVPETMPLDDVLGIMREERAQLVVVMDEHGGTEGILSIEDLFEEVVGQIDESEEAPEITEDEDHKLHVAGTVRVEEVGEHYDRVLEHDEVDSVSGLVLALLGRPPKIGDRVDYEGFTFEVTAVIGHGVDRARVTPPTDD